MHEEHPVTLAPTPPTVDAETLASLQDPPLDPGARPAAERQSKLALAFLTGFVVVPLLALIVAIPLAWGGFFGWSDLVLLVLMYTITAVGITVGFHRHFTHGSFKARRPLRIALAVAGSYAVEGPVDRWVADHRKHHAFSDKDGDPHSPWRYGERGRDIAKGLAYAHVGWLFDIEQTSRQKYTPDLLADPDISRISRGFPMFVAGSLLIPTLLGGLLTWSWMGMVTAFFWAGLVRIALVHHVTWSINSICHVAGEKPYKSRDRSGNVWWLAIPSLGESWHNVHHTDPTCARHGLDKGQIDISARLIAWCERLGWAHDVRWPKRERFDARRASALDTA
jgi:stearoyl-CoA desaturase (delta-9 desaturase)